MWLFKNRLSGLFIIISLIGTCAAQGSFNKELLIRCDTTAVPPIENGEYLSGNQWFALDKGQHLIGSMMLTIGAAKSLQKFFNTGEKQSVRYGASFSLLIGVGKEGLDGLRKGNHFSFKDLVADLAGITLGILILNID